MSLAFFSSHKFSHLSFSAQSLCIWSHCFFMISACLYLIRGAAAWQAGWAALPAPGLVLGSKNNSGDHDYINRWWWKYTCRGSLDAQTLFSLLCNSRSQWKRFSHQGILHTSFYPNTKSNSKSMPSFQILIHHKEPEKVLFSPAS